MKFGCSETDRLIEKGPTLQSHIERIWSYFTLYHFDWGIITLRRSAVVQEAENTCC